MAFFSRPNLEDLQFKQIPGSILSLSGMTRIKTWSGLTLSDGAGGDVLITLSGASSANTEGFSLVYTSGCVSLRNVSGGSASSFDTDRYTTRAGVPSVCVGGPDTVNNFLEGYFFPAVGPSSSISVVSGGASRQFGDAGYGNLNYSATRETNQICLVAVSNNGVGTYTLFPVTTPIAGDYASGTTYTYPGTCPIPPTGTSQTSVSYSVCVQDTSTCTSVSSASITWRNQRFSFKSTTLYTDGSISAALSGGELSTTKNKILSNQSFSNQFFYYVYPTSFGTPVFTVNGLPNNAWGNAGTGTLYMFNYTNTNGYVNQYYVARSDNRISGTYNIVIS